MANVALAHSGLPAIHARRPGSRILPALEDANKEVFLATILLTGFQRTRPLADCRKTFALEGAWAARRSRSLVDVAQERGTILSIINSFMKDPDDRTPVIMNKFIRRS